MTSPEQRGPKGPVFTDEQVARIKDGLAGPDDAWFDGYSVGTIKALLARMEASERKNKAADAYDDFDCTHDAEHRCKCGTIQMKLLKEFREADEAWRRAAGK